MSRIILAVTLVSGYQSYLNICFVDRDSPGCQPESGCPAIHPATRDLPASLQISNDDIIDNTEQLFEDNILPDIKIFICLITDKNGFIPVILIVPPLQSFRPVNSPPHFIFPLTIYFFRGSLNIPDPPGQFGYEILNCFLQKKVYAKAPPCCSPEGQSFPERAGY